jgi:4-hydroxy 2-oxovalerate aldolase
MLSLQRHLLRNYMFLTAMRDGTEIPVGSVTDSQIFSDKEDGLEIDVGFHAHNNLGMAIANSVVAVQSGAKIIDGAIMGFGAGAGNAQLEVLVAVFEKLGIETGVDLYRVLDCASVAASSFVKSPPLISPISIVSGIAGVFSGFSKHVDRAAQQYGVDPRDIFFELGKRKVVGGQEDLIIQVAESLSLKVNN